ALAEEVSIDGDIDDNDAPHLEVSEVADIEEVDAIGEGEFGFREDESTNVFSVPIDALPAVPAPSALENAYQYSEPAWSPAAPPYAPQPTPGLLNTHPQASPVPISGLPPTPVYTGPSTSSIPAGLPVPPPPPLSA